MARKPASPKTIADVILLLAAQHSKSPADILWVGAYDGKLALSWPEFAIGPGSSRPPRRVYRWGAGVQAAIATDLIVAGDGWWIQRVPGSTSRFMYVEPPCYAPEHEAFTFIIGPPKKKLAEAQQAPHTSRGQLSRAGRRRRHPRFALAGAPITVEELPSEWPDGSPQ